MNDRKKPLVGIIMGSSSDSRIMHGAAEILDKFHVKHEDQIISAHRTPTRLDKYAKHAESNGFKVIIAGAGGAAHLPGMIASHTVIPVIGVPIMVYNDKQGKKTEKHKFSAFGGLDSLLSISEMPSGSPVVTVGVNKATNAGIYALKILGNEFVDLRKKLRQHKETQHKSVLKESDEMKRVGLSKFVKKKFK
jgi:5-(carboxyamino)imidazole ribonucleotide mutase